MKKIILILLVLVISLNFYSQDTFLDFPGNIPCLKSRKVNYVELNNLLIDKVDDLSQIQTDFKLGDNIFILNRDSKECSLYVKYSLYADSLSSEMREFVNLSKGFLLVDKDKQKCLEITLSKLTTEGVKKKKNNILQTNCISASTFNADCMVWSIEELSNKYPYRARVGIYYEFTTYPDEDNRPYSLGDFIIIRIYEENKVILVKAKDVENELQHNINTITYDEFWKIIITLEKQIGEGKYYISDYDETVE